MPGELPNYALCFRQVCEKENPTTVLSGPNDCSVFRQQVTVQDINNNSPEFSQGGNYETDIQEAAADGTPVISIQVTDADQVILVPLHALV